MEEGFKHIPKEEMLPPNPANKAKKKKDSSIKGKVGALIGAGIAVFTPVKGGEPTQQQIADTFAGESGPGSGQVVQHQDKDAGRGARKRDEQFEDGDQSGV